MRHWLASPWLSVAAVIFFVVTLIGIMVGLPMLGIVWLRIAAAALTIVAIGTATHMAWEERQRRKQGRL